MKNHKKNYFKTNLIGFILGGFLISGVAVYAAVTFPSNDVTYDNNDLSDQINDENSKTWNGKIGLPTVSEYIRVNSNTSLCGTFSTHVKYRNTCKQTSWMSNAPDWWTLSANAADSYNAYAVNFYAYFMNQSVANKVSFGVRPAIYLKSDLNLSGSGTSSDPYTIE